jgi:mRNA-degrading endonuclease toxin of MazEF toxin-antitoxin module
MKDFIYWHTIKRDIHNQRPRIYFKEREIWFCHLGENIGFEQDGRGNEFLRPVLIVKKFNHELFWALPLTKKHRPDNPYYFAFTFKDGVTSSAILSQLRMLDSKRLKYQSGTASEMHFSSIKTKIRQLIA